MTDNPLRSTASQKEIHLPSKVSADQGMQLDDSVILSLGAFPEMAQEGFSSWGREMGGLQTGGMCPSVIFIRLRMITILRGFVPLGGMCTTHTVRSGARTRMEQ